MELQESSWINLSHQRFVILGYVIDFEKAFENVVHATLWKIVHCRITENRISFILASYDNSKMRVIHNGELAEQFLVDTDVHKGCL